MFMAFPEINPFIETFLEPTRIFLFGKPFPTLSYNATPIRDESTGPGPSADADPPPGGPEFEEYTAGAAGSDLPMPPSEVEQALRRAEGEGIFARIYGFSFEG